MTRRRTQNDIFGLCQRPAVRKRCARRFLRSKNRIENEEGRGFGRGTALEQSESEAGQNIGPGGADDRPRGFAERNATEREQAPGCERGATFEQSEKWGSEHAAPVGATTERCRFLRSKNRVENEEGRGFAVGDPGAAQP